MMTTIDRLLAQRLERAEGATNAAYVEARAQVEPGVGATWTEVAGAYAMFDGVGSPLTQTFGVGMFGRFGPAEFDAVEVFFESRRAATQHELAAHAAAETTQLLPSRGYVPIEQSVVLIRETAAALPGSASGISVRRIREHESEHWARVSAAGWKSEGDGLSAFVEQMGRMIAAARGAHCFLAELAGEPIAAAALSLASNVALLAGASTVPTARGRGAQRALLDARLRFAAAHGADLAMVVTAPDSGSQRNAERAGFRVAYQRTKWERNPFRA